MYPRELPTQALKTFFLHRVPLLDSRFRFAGERTLFGHARFFGDRIELVGWRGPRRVRRRLPLASIVEMQYQPLDEGCNLILTVDEGEEIRLQVDEAHLWRQHFEHWLSYHVGASAKVVGGRAPYGEDQAAALSG